MVAPPAPHAPYTAATRHEDTFADVNAPRTKNYNLPCGPLGNYICCHLTVVRIRRVGGKSIFKDLITSFMQVSEKSLFLIEGL